MHDRVWVSFDLAPGGDQRGMYRWLSQHAARECGPGLATLLFTFKDDLADELAASIARAVRLGPADRAYIIFKDQADGEVTGRFIFGARAENFGDPTNPHPMTLLQ